MAYGNGLAGTTMSAEWSLFSEYMCSYGDHVEQNEFREAMSRCAAAVHVITTDGRGGKAGFTATAFSSVSDSPPTLLICVNRLASSLSILERNRTFCVNTVRAEDEEVANIFAGRTGVARESRFDVNDWYTLYTGAPVLRTAICAFDCVVSDITTVGSHDVCFGEVKAIHFGEPGAALVYHERAFKCVR